jgi:hypothetical protein
MLSPESTTNLTTHAPIASHIAAIASHIAAFASFFAAKTYDRFRFIKR